MDDLITTAPAAIYLAIGVVIAWRTMPAAVEAARAEGQLHAGRMYLAALITVALWQGEFIEPKKN